jgi:eukaryotic-like serine/threonine-protein kinase
MNLTAAEYAQLRELFAAALETDEAGRAALLREHGKLAPLVEEMLAADAAGHALLDGGAAEMAGELLEQAGGPRMCGPYELREVMGEGGSGVVYRGWRADLGAFAAIKLLRDAWVSPERRERFAREQRTLAPLQHPGIVKLLDAGLTADGTPWFAMELVEGTPLTRYAEEAGLGLEGRLRMFGQVCAAVQYAHEAAILHRDLKPSNILIDRTGAPRLLDFGIARQLDGTGAEVTRPEMRMMTPAYAAPEQKRGEALGIYTDVYALGVILRELVAETAAGKTARTELEAICGKAAHAEPGQRYRSVDGLARDVVRYLAGEALEARPDTAWYRTGRFLRRHRGKVAALAVLAAAAGASGAYFTWQLRVSRDAAVAAALRAQRIQGFLTTLLEGGDAEAGPARGLTVETLIERGVREAGLLAHEPGVQGEVLETLGRMTAKLGRHEAAAKLLEQAVEKNRGGAREIGSLSALAQVKGELGEFDAAQGLAERAVAEAVRRLRDDDDLRIGASETLGGVLTERGKYKEAVATLRPALARREASGEPAAIAAAATALASAHFYAGELDESRELNLRALAARKQAHGERHPLVADCWLNLGAIEFERGRYGEAERYYRQVLEVKREWYGARHPATASAQTMLGRALVYQDRHGEARVLLEEALATQRAVFGGDHPNVASALNDLGNIFVGEGKYAEADRSYGQMEEIYRRTRGDGHYLVATAMSNRANVRLRMGDAAGAERILRDVIGRYTRALSAEHPNTAIARIRLGRALLRQKRYRETIAESGGGYELLGKQAKAPVSWLQGARQDLAAAHGALGETELAERFRREHAEAGK